MKTKVFRILLGKYIQESMTLGIPLAVILFAFPWVRIWTVSQFELSGFAPMIEQFRAFEKFSPVPLEQFLTYQGILGLTFAEPVLLLCVLAWSISRGSDVVSGELGRGTMEMLLAQPVRRWNLLAAHGTIAIGGLTILSLLVYGGIVMGIATNSTPMRESHGWAIDWLPWNLPSTWSRQEMAWIPLGNLVEATLYVVPTIQLFALGFSVLGMSTAISAFDQYRWRAIGTIMGVYVTQMLIFILAKSTPSMSFLKPMTFLSAYQPDWTVQATMNDPQAKWYFLMPGATTWEHTIGPLGYVSILLSLGVAGYALAFWRLETRDLPAPQ